MEHFSKYQSFLDTIYNLAPETPEKLEAVYERVSEGCREFVLLRFTTKWLKISANMDDDTIAICIDDDAYADPSDFAQMDGSPPWGSFVGKVFGWGWIAVNQQGYCDSILLSFEGIEPKVLLHVSGSSIHQYNIVPAGGTVGTEPG